MRLGILDKRLRPVASGELVRIGRDADGGYVVNRMSVQSSDCLLALGISDDWSFEAAFLAMHPVPLVAFDGSVGLTVFLKRALRSVCQVTRPKRVAKAWRTLFGFLRFFRGERTFVRTMVAPASEHTQFSFEDLLSQHVSGRYKHVFFKCDIEGSEYRILDSLVRNHEIFSGIVIEFHNVDYMEEKIVDFIDRFPMRVTHVHSNNFPGLSASATPFAIEVTFAPASETYGGAVTLPSELDRPNNPKEDEIELRFVSRDASDLGVKSND